MIKPTSSNLVCPTCHGPVFEQRREIDATDRVAFLFADLPFWVLFGICGAIGMWQWLAGVVAFAVALAIFYLWHRNRFSFWCFACDAEVTIPELPKDRSANA